ncbi:Small G protein signaling modulator 1 [Manis javanica]|nr:Small G protein signaling modulator 1 [Manis javanica]
MGNFNCCTDVGHMDRTSPSSLSGHWAFRVKGPWGLITAPVEDSDGESFLSGSSQEEDCPVTEVFPMDQAEETVPLAEEQTVALSEMASGTSESDVAYTERTSPSSSSGHWAFHLKPPSLRKSEHIKDSDVESFLSGISEEKDCPGLPVITVEHYFETWSHQDSSSWGPPKTQRELSIAAEPSPQATMVFAAANHDYERTGTTNNFHIQTWSDIAILHNDRSDLENHHRLLRTIKKEVKQIMEEAVTWKFVHEDSSHIISFCAAVEACVLHGLQRRAAGFLRSNKVAALFMKIQGLRENVRKLLKLPSLSPLAIKHLWIRTALFEKVLDKIVHYLVENSSKYYEKEALLMDPVDGPILVSLPVGPCTLEYTKMKTANLFWTDPSANELVQRHRIHSSHLWQTHPPSIRPSVSRRGIRVAAWMTGHPSACDFVESLHQNSRATLLYGKNNVLVQPSDDMEAVPGYLSLHQTADIMTLKWTPNQLWRTWTMRRGFQLSPNYPDELSSVLKLLLKTCKGAEKEDEVSIRSTSEECAFA